MSIFIGSRYQSSRPIRVPDAFGALNRTVFRTPQTPSDDFETYLTVYGDRLDLIAARLYGDASRWWVIADANPSLTQIEPLAAGTSLRIPYGAVLR